MPILPFLLHLGDFYLAWGKEEKAIEAYKKKVDAQIKAFPRIAENNKRYTPFLKKIMLFPLI